MEEPISSSKQESGRDAKGYVTTAPVKAMRPQVGQLINNKYRLTKLLGDGGMGSVFEAQHEMLGNAVALKFLHPELARRQGLVQRFLQEARVSAKIDSKHVVKVTDVEQTPTGLPFMVMEFLKGKSLQALYEDNYRAGRRLAYEEALKYGIQILDGLEAAHDEGVVHRDLKPDNVMIVQGKRNESIVKLLDFGIAKLKINGDLYKGLTRPGVIMGTPEYMAPEQVFSADAVDARADIFSCGVMIFEMLAGRRPVGGDEAHQIAAAYLSGNIAKLSDLAPHVPQGLSDAIHTAMAADPKDRFAAIADFRMALEPYTAEISRPRSTSTPPPVVSGRDSNPLSPRNEERGSSVPLQPISSDPKSPRAVNSPAIVSTPAQGGIELAGTVAAVKSPDGWVVDENAAKEPASNGGGLGALGAATDKMSHPWVGDDVAAISAKLKAAAGDKDAEFASTVEGQPFFPGSTDAYQPSSDAPRPQRPGGTDIIGGGYAPLPSTASYEAAYEPAPPKSFAGAPASQFASISNQQRRRRSGMGLGSILIIGTIIAGAVVAGVYAFENAGKGKTKDEPRTVALPSHTTTTQPVTAETVLAQRPAPTPSPTPVFTQPTQTQKPTGPKPTGPRPTAPSNQPPIIPSVIPGLPDILPPIDLPFPGMGRTPTNKQPPPADPGSNPDKGKPNPKPGRPKLEPIPTQGANDPAPSNNSSNNATGERPQRQDRATKDANRNNGSRGMTRSRSRGYGESRNESGRNETTHNARADRSSGGSNGGFVIPFTGITIR